MNSAKSRQKTFVSTTVVIILFASTLVCITPSAAGGDSTDSLQAGTARIDITPPVPYRMSGYFHERLSTGIHDPLLAKALVLRQGDRRAALVFCDLIGFQASFTANVRTQIERQTGIPQEHIAIIATHSHTGPLYFGRLRDKFHDQAIAATGEDSLERIDYPKQLADRLVEAVRQADAAVEPIKLASGVGRQDTLAFNRRFHMKDGTVRFNPGYMNPNIVRVAGPIDPQVGIVLLRAENRPAVSLVSYALHLDTTGGTEYSADYPYYLATALRKELGDGAISLFGTGTCGDINHVDVTSRDRRRPDVIGPMLARSIIEALPSLVDQPQPSLDMRQAIVTVPLQQYTEDEIVWACETIEHVGDRAVPFLDRVRAYKIMDIKARQTDKIDLEVQVFKLSNQTAVVTLPGEVFVDLGQAIKAASPFETTLVIELANDAPGYLPTNKAFKEGSYETVNSRIAPGGAEKMVELAIKLLQDLKPETDVR